MVCSGLKKRLVLMFTTEFARVCLFKDVGMVPYYLGRRLGCSAEIFYHVASLADRIEANYRGMELRPVVRFGWPDWIERFDKLHFLRNLRMLATLVRRARSIDVLMMFHLSVDKALFCWLYKSLNPGGKFYLKLDMSVARAVAMSEDAPGWRAWFYGALQRSVLKHSDLLTCETRETFNQLTSRGLLGVDVTSKLALLGPGFDQEYLEEASFPEPDYRDKQDLMIAVGRLGAPEKNIAMVLEALCRVDLDRWKFAFIGPMDETFLRLVEQYRASHPQLMERLLLVGEISNRFELYEYYRRAKVLVLTSLWESGGIVLTEAACFGSYIISTPVGCALEVTDDGRLGSIVAPTDVDGLIRALEQVVAGEVDLERLFPRIVRRARENFFWGQLILEPRLKELLMP